MRVLVKLHEEMQHIRTSKRVYPRESHFLACKIEMIPFDSLANDLHLLTLSLPISHPPLPGLVFMLAAKWLWHP